MSFFVLWTIAFTLTQLVEAPIYYACIRARTSFGRLQSIGAALVPSLVTHPMLWLTYLALVRRDLIVDEESYWRFAYVAECIIFLVEASILSRWISWLWAWRASLLANAASMLVGLALRDWLASLVGT